MDSHIHEWGWPGGERFVGAMQPLRMAEDS